MSKLYTFLLHYISLICTCTVDLLYSSKTGLDGDKSESTRFPLSKWGVCHCLVCFSLWNDVIESVKLLSISVLKPHNIAHIHS